MNDILKVTELAKNYPGFKLEEVSFELPRGYIMGVIGPNGSGKTTIIKAILNMIDRDSGGVTLFGKDNIAHEQEIKKGIGVVVDASYFVEEWDMTDVENAYKLFYSGWDSDKYHQLLKRFRIDLAKRVKALSKGMQMKLMLACAFSYDAKLLVLDEPTSGLDPVSRDELLEILAEYIADGEHSVLFSTHITSDLEKIADYITYVQFGKLIFTGSKEEFTEQYRIVSGDNDVLSPELRQNLIGLRSHTTGFEAMMKSADLDNWGHLLASSPAAIEDIVVFGSRDTQNNRKGDEDDD